MKKTILTTLLLPLLIWANPAKTTNILLLEVNGIVCNFCAFGIERDLKKFAAVDHNHFGGDGVLVDVDTSLVNVALKPKHNYSFADLNKAVKSAGYPVIAAFANVEGKVSQTSDGLIITARYNGQKYLVSDDKLKPFVNKNVKAKLKIDSKAMENHQKGQPIASKLSSVASL